MLVLVFAGEKFLIDPIGQRQLRSGDFIVNGRKIDGYDTEDWDDQYSVHYTYNFNIFVFMTIFNFVNSRKLDSELNVFSGITRSKYFLYMITIIIVL